MIVKDISLSFENRTVLDNFSFDFPDNKITCILGASGCGKTTLLNVIAGLLTPNCGVFESEHKVSYLFQEPRLLPWKTVLENVSIVLNGNVEKAKESLSGVGLSDYLFSYPSELSGGMKQRVAIARAFSYPSEIILMDEPFQSLDVRLRNKLAKEFVKVWEKERKTVLWVTHDITEACLAADKILIVNSNPMHKVTEFDISLERSTRNTKNCAEYYSRIYDALTR